jgi:hypothetical protein
MVPQAYNHLPLPLVRKGKPRRTGGGSTAETEANNKANRGQHSTTLTGAGQRISENHKRWLQERPESESHPLPAGIPLILQTEPGIDLDFLRTAFKFEVIAESDEGFVLVASEDIELTEFIGKAQAFANSERGSGAAAKVYGLVEDGDDRQARLRRLLSEGLYVDWPTFQDGDIVTVDLSIACAGTTAVPNKPIQEHDENDARYNVRLERYQRSLKAWWNEFDELMLSRENELTTLVTSYGGTVLEQTNAPEFPDCFVMRASLPFQGLRDIVFNHPHLFEVTEPEDVVRLESKEDALDSDTYPELEPPDIEAPLLGIVDSGIQEAHPLLAAAVDGTLSISFVPGDKGIADLVKSNGHGTRVAGAALYRGGISQGNYRLPFRVANIRVLDNSGNLSKLLVPQDYVGKTVAHIANSSKTVKVFNHSISSKSGFRKTYMSAWAASIDQVSYDNDVLFVQASGNLFPNEPSRNTRSVNHYLANGFDYPDYLLEDGCRIANPAQSFQALTVGSISPVAWVDGARRSMGGDHHPSGFTSTGPGIWGSIKPEVVEIGGCLSLDSGTPPTATFYKLSSLDIVRATFTSPGKLTSQDACGTTFAASRVSGLLAEIQRLLPYEPALLYRALVANAARWPEWAEESPNPENVIRFLGYGVPKEELALHSTDFRVTLITKGHTEIGGSETHIYRIPIPEQLRQPSEDSLIRLDVTLSYSARPRRSRRNPRGYLSTWLDWKSCCKSESYDSFAARIVQELDGQTESNAGGQIGWMLREQAGWGQIPEAKRSVGTLQKDWAFLHAYELPEDFCIAVKGHKGWDKNSEDKAKYTLAVTIESIGSTIELYSEIETALQAVIELPAVEVAL